MKRQDFKLITNCKAIQGEEVVSQHRLLVADMRLGIRRKKAKVFTPRIIKTWNLKRKNIMKYIWREYKHYRTKKGKNCNTLHGNQ